MKATVSTAAAIIIAAGGVLLATTHADALEVTSAPVGPQPVIVQTLVATPAAATAAPAAAPAPASAPGAVVVQELTAMPAQPTPAQATAAQRVEAPAQKRVEAKAVEAKPVEAPAAVAVVTAAPAQPISAPAPAQPMSAPAPAQPVAAPAQPISAPAPAQPASAAAPANPATPASETAALEAEVAALVNDERSARGLGHVEVRAEMSAAAHAWSAEMLRRGVMQHSTSVPQFAYNAVIPSGWQWAAENVAVTAGSRGNVAQEFMTMWMDSPGHRENILNPAATSVGVGIATDGDRYYATQIFASY